MGDDSSFNKLKLGVTLKSDAICNEALLKSGQRLCAEALARPAFSIALGIGSDHDKLLLDKWMALLEGAEIGFT